MNRPAVPGRLLPVSGHQLHMYTAGGGGPTVVLEAGAGGTSLEWRPVIQALSDTMTVCAYDRGGLGWSEPGPRPRASAQLVIELHQALQAAEIPAPYLLVGHSFGGLLVRQFAATHPQKVIGCVLVDAAHEAHFERMPDGVRAARDARLRMLSLGEFLSRLPLVRNVLTPVCAPGLPTDIAQMAKHLGAQPAAYAAVHDEAAAFDVSVKQLKLAGRLSPSLPLVVLSRSRPQPWPKSVDSAQAEAIWRQLQEELAGLSPTSRHIVVEDTGHYIHVERPNAVIAAIRQMVAELS